MPPSADGGAGETIEVDRHTSLGGVSADALARAAWDAAVAARRHGGVRPLPAADAASLLAAVREAVRARVAPVERALVGAYEAGLDPDALDPAGAGGAAEAACASFLASLGRAMALCNFVPLSAAEAAAADASEYSLDAPVRVDWGALEALPSVGSSAAPPPAAPLGSKLRVWHSGLEQDERTGRFVVARVNALAARAALSLTWPLPRPLRAGARSLLGVAGASERVAARSLARGERVRTARRVRVQSLPVRALLSVAPVTICEPRFSRVCVAYRPRGGARVHVRMFKDVPMADLELCYPNKKAALNATEALKAVATLLVGLVAALAAAYGSLARAEGGGGGALAGATRERWGAAAYALLAALGSLAMRQHCAVAIAQARLDAAVSQASYDKLIDANKGTLLHLLHAAREQDVKETLLCYAVVCRARAAGEGALGAAEVRARAEAALEGDFGLRHSAFDVEDALVKCEAILGRA